MSQWVVFCYIHLFPNSSQIQIQPTLYPFIFMHQVQIVNIYQWTFNFQWEEHGQLTSGSTYFFHGFYFTFLIFKNFSCNVFFIIFSPPRSSSSSYPPNFMLGWTFPSLFLKKKKKSIKKWKLKQKTSIKRKSMRQKSQNKKSINKWNPFCIWSTTSGNGVCPEMWMI